MQFVMRMVDEDFVLARHPDVGVVRVGDRLVIGGPTGLVAELDARGSLLWPLFDGAVTVGELALDVAEVFEIPYLDALNDIIPLVNNLVARDLLLDLDAMVPERVAPEPSPFLFVPEPCCGSPLPDIDFLPPAAVELGSRIVGIRSSLPAIDAAVRLMFRSRLVDRPEVGPNVSLVYQGAIPATPVPTIQLFVQNKLVGRSPSSAWIGELLAFHLVGFGATSGDLLWVEATPVGTPEGVVLVAPAQQPILGALGNRFHREGIAIGPSFVGIDLATLEVVLTAADLQADDEGIRAFGQLSDWEHNGAPLLTAGRYPIRAFGLTPAPTDDSDGLHREYRLGTEGRILQNALPLIGGLADYGVQRAMDEVLALAARLPVSQPEPGQEIEWLFGGLGRR